eukprot:TRINITY_DN10064_c4_g1_i1.p1 TRINITY_DN10064_c4_g1~~TRINITY_DN10064_c4_g1_i1.p1  ORF type:complete len:536 (-),score=134.60 TRINITY_DN10064_c4_g1_i1:301-1722(-)
MAELPSLRLKGCTRMEVRGRRPRNAESSVVEGNSSEEPPTKRAKLDGTDDSIVIQDSDGEAEAQASAAEASKGSETEKPRKQQILRISAGRAAAAAGIHCYADVGELFLELLYQDLPELLLQDAAIAGVEIVSPAAERARLLAKSGMASEIEAALKKASEAPGVDGAKEAREAVSQAVASAERSERLDAQEAQELRQTLELEVNLEFGARHEDAAISAYEARLGTKVYGQQHRVALPLQGDGPEAALAQAFPAPHPGVRPRHDVVDGGTADASSAKGNSNSGSSSSSGGGDGAKAPLPHFRLTGFVDGLVDVVRGIAAPANPPLPGRGRSYEQLPPMTAGSTSQAGSPSETLVVEVKHRMGRIKDPPDVYDIVQLCSYCRALGCTRGDLVQCLRGGSTNSAQPDLLHVTRIDFSEGSPDRTGWDKHVLPGLYALAGAIYATRENQPLRLQLLTTTDSHERSKLVGDICPHLGR